MNERELSLTRASTEMGSFGTVKVWNFEVTDFEELPDAYKLPHLVKIRKVISLGIAIPGVKSWQDEILRITPR